MSGLAGMRDQIVEPLMEATALNRLQDRLLHDPSPEIDSLREIFCALARFDLRDRDRLKLAALGVRMVDQIAAHNAAEGEHVKAGTGIAERLGRSNGTLKDFARELRPLLGDLASPLIGAERRRARTAAVVEVLGHARPGQLFDPSTGRISVSFAHELGSPAKATALQAVITEHLARAT